jgi:hypothetical protein
VVERSLSAMVQSVDRDKVGLLRTSTPSAEQRRMLINLKHSNYEHELTDSVSKAA